MTIRVFVGTSPNGEDAEAAAVLEHTLRKHASEQVDIIWMALSRDPKSLWSDWNSTNFSTPFTPFRWTIPEACRFTGRALYMDVDTFAVADVAELWRQPMAPGVVALVNSNEGKLRTCVALFDCAAAQSVIPPVAELKRMDDAHEFMTKRLLANRHLLGAFKGKWNCVDLKGSSLDDPDLKVVHMSSIAHQPHFPHAVRRLAAKGQSHWYSGAHFDHWRPELIERFDVLLVEAAAAGFTPDRYEPAKPFGAYPMRSYQGVRVKGYSKTAA